MVHHLRQLQFQSHNGAIATALMDREAVWVKTFQSHNGAIATAAPSSTSIVKNKFQSHNGAIATNFLMLQFAKL